MRLVMRMGGGRRENIILWNTITIFATMFCEVLPDFLSFCGDLVFVSDVIIMIFIGGVMKANSKTRDQPKGPLASRLGSFGQNLSAILAAAQEFRFLFQLISTWLSALVICARLNDCKWEVSLVI